MKKISELSSLSCYAAIRWISITFFQYSHDLCHTSPTMFEIHHANNVSKIVTNKSIFIEISYNCHLGNLELLYVQDPFPERQAF